VGLALEIIKTVASVPILGGTIFSLLCVLATWRLLAARTRITPSFFPPVSILKPVYGLDRDLEDNLLSFCRQDYPEFQLVLCVQRLNDPALPILRRVAHRYPEIVTLVVKESEPVFNGKIQNISNGLEAALHEFLVISDADVRVAPDYLRTIISPLHDPAVGFSCTLYRTADARTTYDKLELLSMNADFLPSLLFTAWTNAAVFCLGATVAVRRTDVDAVGGIPSLAEFLVEDQEMGRRLVQAGKRMSLSPTFVEIIPDYRTFRQWWSHQVYWDQNTKAANPLGFALTILTRAIPFALIFLLADGFGPLGSMVFAFALTARLGTAAVISRMLGDRESLRALWLLPFRDFLGLVSWAAALSKRTFLWRGNRFRLDRRGRIFRVRPGQVTVSRS